MSHSSPSFSNGRPFPVVPLLLASAAALAGGVAEASAQTPLRPWPSMAVVPADSTGLAIAEPPIETTARGRRAIKGAVIGGGVGLALATLMWALNPCFDDNGECPRESPVAGMAVSTVLGALIGAIIGAESHGGKENEARRGPGNVALLVGPAAGGANLGVVVRF